MLMLISIITTVILWSLCAEAQVNLPGLAAEAFHFTVGR
jgi:hypothetical protein